MSRTSVVIYCCSPRPMGNSDKVGEILRDALTEAGAAVEVLQLRKYKILPCRGCHRCEHDQDGRCYLMDMDQSGRAFAPLLKSDVVFLVSPIYFYHLPSPFKALIDRSQTYYQRKLAGNPQVLSLPHRRAFPVFIAGRDKGKRLFEGSLLTLKYFLDSFNIELAEPLLFRGMDDIGELSANARAQEEVREYGLTALRDIAKII